MWCTPLGGSRSAGGGGGGGGVGGTGAGGGGDPALAAVRYWLYLFYVSKYWELGDTFVLLARGKPLTLLHVWHHMSVMVETWAWLQFDMTLGAVGMAVNAGVHVLMYAYFGASVRFFGGGGGAAACVASPLRCRRRGAWVGGKVGELAGRGDSRSWPHGCVPAPPPAHCLADAASPAALVHHSRLPTRPTLLLCPSLPSPLRQRLSPPAFPSSYLCSCHPPRRLFPLPLPPFSPPSPCPHAPPPSLAPLLTPSSLPPPSPPTDSGPPPPLPAPHHAHPDCPVCGVLCAGGANGGHPPLVGGGLCGDARAGGVGILQRQLPCPLPPLLP